MTLYAAVDELKTALEAAGVRVVTDPSTFTPHAAVIEAPVVATTTMGAYTLEVPVAVVAPQPANESALRWLLETLPTVLNVVRANRADPGVYMPNANQPFPCYRVTVTITVEGK